MYFHLFDAYTKELHEILGLLFVAAAALHVYANWGAMRRYFPKKTFLAALTAIAVVSALFIGNAESGPNPKHLLIDRALVAPLELSLPLLGTDAATADERLKSEGIDIAKGSTLSEVARNNGVSPFALVA